jgi:hypothetical protein
MTHTANTPTPAFQTTSGKTITVEQTYDHSAYNDGRGWNIGLQTDPSERPHSVANVTIRKAPYGQPGFTAEVNWSAWGAQSPAVAADFAEAIAFAARWAQDDLEAVRQEQGA